MPRSPAARIDDDMHFGLTTPIVTLTPRSHAPWEENAGPEALRRIAVVADQLGYYHLTCSEHVAIPVAVAATRGRRYYDPLATLAYVAALTRRIRLATHVLVLPYHHPLAVAKRYGTLDRLSGGRLILGVGVGTLREEFDLLGVEFSDRGRRYEDALRALRRALSAEQPMHRGPFFAFSDFVIDPAAVQDRIPIWIGGRTARSLRRALAFGDGWDPFGLGLRELGSLVARARDSGLWSERTKPFDLVFSLERLFDVRDAGQREQMTDLIGAYARIGATILSLRFRHQSLDHFIEQLHIFATDVAPRFAEAAVP